MKTWQDLEEQFRSWTPRQPSARLKARIEAQAAQGVGAQVIGPSRTRPTAHAWQWFAPAMAVFVLAFGLSSPSSDGLTQLISSPTTGRMSSLALEDPDLATYFASHSGHNGFSVATFEWTNRNEPVTTTDPATESSSTNRLRR